MSGSYLSSAKGNYMVCTAQKTHVAKSAQITAWSGSFLTLVPAGLLVSLAADDRCNTGK